MRCRRPRCTAAAKNRVPSQPRVIARCAVDLECPSRCAHQVGAPRGEGGVSRGCAAARSLRFFISDANDGNVVMDMMRRLQRALEGASWTQHLPFSTLCSRSGASREAFRGLPFFHTTQSTLHRAQRRCYDRPGVTRFTR